MYSKTRKMLKSRIHKHFLILIMSIFFLHIFSMPSKSAEISTDYLLSVCEADAEGKETVAGGHITCQAYIAGVVDYHSLYYAVASPQIGICVPSDVSLSALQKIVVEYIKKNPQHLGFVAAPAVILALNRVYPCK